MTISNETAAAALEEAAEASCAALDAVADRDWTSPAHASDWSTRQVVEHIGGCFIGYAGQVIGQPDEGYLIPDIPLEPQMTSSDAVAYVRVAGQILALAVRTTPPSARGYHPYGQSDPVGFAGMGIIESLVHTGDVMRGFGVDWQVPAGPCRLAVDRLFTAEAADLGPELVEADPVGVLLWCTGRQPLGDHEQRARWRWNGLVPA